MVALLSPSLLSSWLWLPSCLPPCLWLPSCPPPCFPLGCGCPLVPLPACLLAVVALLSPSLLSSWLWLPSCPPPCLPLGCGCPLVPLPAFLLAVVALLLPSLLASWLWLPSCPPPCFPLGCGCPLVPLPAFLLAVVALFKLPSSPSPQIALQLLYAYNQVLSVLTNTQLEQIFDRNPGFDLRYLLQGSEKFVDNILNNVDSDPSFILCGVCSQYSLSILVSKSSVY